MLAMVILTIRVNSVIQMSIVDQQYARAQTLWLAFNSNTYPILRLRESQLTAKGWSQMTLGVSDKTIQQQDGEEGTGTIQPTAPTELISPPGAPQGDNGPQDVGTQRSLIRVRNTVTLCTQPTVINTQNGTTPLLQLTGNQTTTFTPTGKWMLGENTTFQYCNGVATASAGATQ